MGVALGMIFYELARKLSGVPEGTRSIEGISKELRQNPTPGRGLDF
jgi:hypothetical protein